MRADLLGSDRNETNRAGRPHRCSAPETDPGTTFSQPIRAITTMLLVCVLVGAGAWAIHGMVIDILRTNPLLNGLIAFVFVFGVATCFWQV